jgi:hypothetical protein
MVLDILLNQEEVEEVPQASLVEFKHLKVLVINVYLLEFNLE